MLDTAQETAICARDAIREAIHRAEDISLPPDQMAQLQHALQQLAGPDQHLPAIVLEITNLLTDHHGTFNRPLS